MAGITPSLVLDYSLDDRNIIVQFPAWVNDPSLIQNFWTGYAVSLSSI